MMRIALASAALLFTSAAVGQDLKSMTLANELGSVLASESLCELSYDQAAITAFIEKRVRADDLAFASTLRAMTSGQEFQMRSMTPSAKTAHCTQIRRVAKANGFVK
jgi:hypothetical protein